MVTATATDSTVVVESRGEEWVFHVITDEVLGHPVLDIVPDHIREWIEENTPYIHLSDMHWLSNEPTPSTPFDGIDQHLDVVNHLEAI